MLDNYPLYANNGREVATENIYVHLLCSTQAFGKAMVLLSNTTYLDVSMNIEKIPWIDYWAFIGKLRNTTRIMYTK